MSQDVRSKLRSEIAPVDWPVLAPHAERGALVLVDTALDLLDVAEAVAGDNSVLVKEWLQTRRLLRIAADADHQSHTHLTTRKLQFVIVQPYVLAQTLPDDDA